MAEIPDDALADKRLLANVLKICIQQKVQLIRISYYLKYFMMKMLK